MKKRLKIDGVLSTFLTFALVFLGWFFYRPKNKALDYVLDCLGMALVVFGQVLRLSGRNFKKEYSREGKSLITDGPYALTRNPMYLGTFVMGAGFIVILWPWWFLVIYTAIFILRFHGLILSEEAKLAAQFGKDFADYLQATPGFIPQPAKLLYLPRYLSLKWPWIRKEWSAIAAWFVAVAVIEGIMERQSFFSLAYLKDLLALSLSFIISGGFFALLLLSDDAKKA